MRIIVLMRSQMHGMHTFVGPSFFNMRWSMSRLYWPRACVLRKKEDEKNKSDKKLSN